MADPNPFADASARNNDVPDVYNPFASDSNNAGNYQPPSYRLPTQSAQYPPQAQASRDSNERAKLLDDENWSDLPSVASSSASQGRGAQSESIAIREQNLRQREAALEERERALAAREQKMQALGFVEPNWPSSCYPLTYHSIKDEIPEPRQAFVYRFYFLCLLTWLCLFWNWIVVLSCWWTSGADGDASQSLWATIFFAFGVPCAWRLWYRSIYYAIRDDSSKKWIFFFVNFGANIIFSGVMAVGIPSWGAAGIWRMIDLFAKKEPTLGVFAVIATIFWVVNCLGGAVCIKIAHSVWRDAGQDKKTKKAVVTAAAQAAVASQQTADDEFV